ncbi:hypothetical protein COCON_G00087830 [Conger conger]|uniref:Uncharacterized protein n=1 Tax=Conger conger TaxID=82655 RepID=A0A9Q1DKG4_CONCO|nr:hypothetical protein COCON_G00087830 [Conger conger]
MGDQRESLRKISTTLALKNEEIQNFICCLKQNLQNLESNSGRVLEDLRRSSAPDLGAGGAEGRDGDPDQTGESKPHLRDAEPTERMHQGPGELRGAAGAGQSDAVQLRDGRLQPSRPAPFPPPLLENSWRSPVQS